jgi:predicted nuclease of predicted toxin-antitoxin system
VKALEYPLLADENIQRGVVRTLGARGLDVTTVRDVRLESGRVVLTQDRDFGRRAIRGGEAFVGIVYFRPGELLVRQVLECIDAIEARSADVEEPFIVVAAHRGDRVYVRLVNNVRSP